MKSFLFGLFKTIVYFFIFIISLILIFIVYEEIRIDKLTIELEKGEIIGNNFIEFEMPSSNWHALRDKNWSEDEKGWGYQRIYNDNIKGVSYTLNFITRPGMISKDTLLYDDILLDKDGKYFDSGNKKTIFNDNDKETGVTYKKNWITYIQNLKCMGSIFSRGFKGSNTNGTTKNYSMLCAYYDKTAKDNDGRRVFDIHFFYNYSGKDIRLQKDKYVKDDEIPTRTYVENILKDEIKNLVKTLKIKNLDVDRMEKEGLMHYDQEFKSTKW